MKTIEQTLSDYINKQIEADSGIDLKNINLDEVLDSLGIVSLFAFIEEEYGVDLFDNNEEINFKDFNSIVKNIEALAVKS